MPGPTGERNTLRFAPRGTILCAASDIEVLLNQFAASFATGNRVAVNALTAAMLPSGLPATVRDAIEVVEERALGKATLAMALVEADLLGNLALRLASRNGALVPVVDTRGCEEIPLWRLVAERAICVNTTAAGGNASLMTLGA